MSAGERRLLGLALLPAVGVLALIVLLGVNVPTTDQWGLPYLFEAYAEGGEWVAGIWALNNEHRVVFPKLVFLPLAFASGWNVKLEMVVSWVAATVGFLAVFGLALRTRGRSAGWLVFAAAVVASSLVYFSLVQHENWLWGFQLAFFLVQGAFLVAVYALAREDWGAGMRIGVAAALCVVASFSMVQGLFAWVVLLVQVVAVGGSVRERVIGTVVWLVMMALVVAAYFWDFVRPATSEDPNYALNHPVAAAWATFAVLGAQFGRTFGGNPVLPAALAGIIFVAAFGAGLVVAAWRRVEYRRVAPWLAVGIFGGLFCLAIGYGRAERGVDGLVTVSRYMTGPPLLVLAVIQLWRVVLEGVGWAGWRRIYVGGCAAVVVAVVVNSVWALGDARKRAAELRLAAVLLPLVNQFEPEVDAYRQNPLTAIVPSLDAPYDGVSFLRRAMPVVAAVGFRKSAPTVEFVDAVAAGRFEGIEPVRGEGRAARPGPAEGEAVTVGANRRVTLAGAIGGLADGGVADAVVITRDGERKIRTATEVVDGRWSVEVPAFFFGAGETEIFAWAYDAETGRAFLLDESPWTLMVKAAENPKKRAERQLRGEDRK